MTKPLLATLVAIGTFACACSAPAADPPRVVVTIKPIHSLVAMAMQGVGEPHLLLDGAASPHTYSLKPSDARVLQDADLVFWVGAGLETFLEKPLQALPKRAHAVALAQAPGVTLLPYRDTGAWEPHVHGRGEAHDHDHDHEQPHAHDHADGDQHDDMHIWLDAGNARAIVEAAAAALAQADPERAPVYRANAERAAVRIAALDQTLRTQLTPLDDRPYIVFHDAYQYLERRYGLDAVGSITVNPDRQPSAQRIASMRAKIVDQQAVCVFSEPQFEPKLITTLIEGTSARVGVLDADGGVGVPAGTDAWVAIMQNLGDALVRCLRPTG